MRSLLLHCSLLLLCSSGFARADVPITHFTDLPEIEFMQISPDGHLLAVAKRSGDHGLLSVVRYPGLDAVSESNLGRLTDAGSLAWANNSRLLFQPERRISSFKPSRIPFEEIFGMDADGQNVDSLFGPRSSMGSDVIRAIQVAPAYVGAEIIDTLEDDPDWVLLKTGSFDPKRNRDALVRLHVRSGLELRLAGSPVQASTFVLDSKKQPLLVTGTNDRGDIQTLRFKSADKTWLSIATHTEREGHIKPFATTADPQEFLALDSLTTSTTALVTWNAVTNQRRELFHNDWSDVSVAGVDAAGKPWLYSYIDPFPEYWYPDPEHPLAKAHRALRAKFKDANIRFTSQASDLSLAVAQVSGPRMPPVFYLLDVKNFQLLQRLPSLPALNEEDLSPTDPFEVVVRDGTRIRGYLTTPKSKPRNAPMVVVIHDGPHDSFDTYDFNPEVQLFASRGYAVLQVNYRGSGGRGRDFMLSGHRRWGVEMQDDITDAVKWAIGYGTADARRICIYGAGYGAYAALTATVRDRTLFKCAIGASGIYDLPLLIAKGPLSERLSGRQYLTDTLGSDMKDLRQRSPVYNADRIEAAVMLIHGKKDSRVPFEHAKRMRAALQKAGNYPWGSNQVDLDRGIYDDEPRAQVYEQMLEFLAKHLKD